MTREEIVEGMKLLEDNMVHFDELQNDKGEWIDVHELLFETIQALSQEPCDDAEQIDSMPTVCDIDAIRDEIEELQQDVLKSSENPLDSAFNISIGISMALGIIDKYTKGEQE